jgi:hypothetical protein
MLFVVGLAVGAAQANMLVNPSFEEGVFEANTAPEGWSITADEGTSQFTWFDDAAGAHWGSKYIKVNTWTGWLGTSGFVWQEVDVTAGEDYAFSVWAKCPFAGETSKAKARVDWYSATGFISWDWLPWSWDVGSNWTHVEFGTVTAPVSATRVEYSLAGIPENVLMGILFDDAYMDTPLPSLPSPVWEAKVPIGDVELSWTNLAPKDVNDVYVDVLFGTEPNETDPDYHMEQLILDPVSGHDVNSVTVEGLGEGTYYWQVNSYIYGDPATTSYETNPGDPNIIKGLVWSFDVVSDAPPSSLDAGPDMITWDGQAVELDAMVEDDGGSELTYAWSLESPAGTDVLLSATDIKDPTVTINKISSSEAAIVNPSFEDRLNGWDTFGDGHGTWTGVWGGKTHIYPTDGEYTAFVDGTYGDPIEGGWLSQTLAETLAAETTYKLTVDVVNDGFYNEDVEYKVQMLAGETVIAEDDDSWPLPLGSGSSSSEWETSTVVYTVGTLGGPSDPNFGYVGEPLGIRLVAKVGTQEMNFDNVHLTAVPPFPAPEVAPIELTVEVTDEANPTYMLKDSMTIDVYDNACQAARVGLDKAKDNLADVNADCDTNLDDLVLVAEKWLSDTGLTEAVESLTADSLSGSLQVQFKQDAAANSQDEFDKIVGDTPPLSGVVDRVTITADGTHVRSHTHSGDYLLIDHIDGDLDNLLSGGVLTDDPDVAVVLTLADLADGSYSITTYHHSQYDGTDVVTFDVQLTDASGTDVLVHDDINNSVGTPVTTAELAKVDTPFIVSGRNDVTLTFTQSGNRLKLNGFVLETTESNDPNIIVDAGVDMVTLSGESVTLAGTATSAAYGDENLVLKWSAAPDDGVVFSDDTSANPTVTITKTTNDPSNVVLTLKATDVGDPFHTAKDWLVIDVYNDACLAA